MKRVVSISLGSSKRDSTSQVEILGVKFEVARIGTDGSIVRFAELMRKYDGKADAITLGGIDRYLWIDDKKYTIKDADRLAKIAKIMLSDIKEGLFLKEIEFEISQELIEKIAELGFDPEFGAREMRRVVQENIENSIAKALLSDKIKAGDKIEIDPQTFEVKTLV